MILIGNRQLGRLEETIMGKGYRVRDFVRKYLFWILICPILVIWAISLIVKWEALHFNTNGLIIDISTPIKLGEYVYYYISVVGIEVTGLLSYAIWKASIESNKLWQDMSNKEENKDKEIVRESALIVYYDLVSNISILKMLYSTQMLKTKAIETNKLNIITDWVKNIGNLRDILTGKEIEMLFNLYNSFSLLSELERTPNPDNESNELKTLVKQLSKKIFISVLLDHLWMDFDGVTESILNNRYYPILRKIQMASKVNLYNDEYSYSSEDGDLCVNQNNESVKYKGEFINGIIQNGTDQWHLDDGTILYALKCENGKVVSGKYSNKFREEKELIFDCKFNGEGKQTEGYTTIFYSPNIMKYQGLIADGKYYGQGKYYANKNSLKLMFSGTFEKGKMLKGKYLNKSSKKIIYFKGEYRNKAPYTGNIECSEFFELDGTYGFKGIIKEGKPIDGSGYKFAQEIIDNEYVNEDYTGDVQADGSDDYNDQYENIPEEMQQELNENYEREKKQNTFDDLKQNYGHVVELIKADWSHGDCTVYDDDIINKKHFAYSNWKKKEV